MLIRKTTQVNRRVYCQGQPFGLVREYKYFSTAISENNDSSQEVRIRIEQAKSI